MVRVADKKLTSWCGAVNIVIELVVVVVPIRLIENSQPFMGSSNLLLLANQERLVHT